MDAMGRGFEQLRRGSRAQAVPSRSRERKQPVDSTDVHDSYEAYEDWIDNLDRED